MGRTIGTQPAVGLALLAGLAGCRPPQPGPPGPPQVQLAILPEAVTVTAGRDLQFGHRILSGGTPDVAWRVVEPGGGGIDAKGRYQAPDHPGVWTVEVRSQANPACTARARVTVVAPPRSRISAPSAVAPGATDLRAGVPAQPGCRFTWNLDGGAILEGADTETITFRAGDGPSLTFRCCVTNPAGDSQIALLDVPVTAPVPLVLAPPRAILTVGRTLTFGYTLSGAQGRVVWQVPAAEGGVDAAGTYQAPDTPGLYTLQAAPAGHPEAGTQAWIKVVPAPVARITGPSTLRTGQADLAARVPDQPGATYAWDIQGGTLTGGQHSPRATFAAGTGSTLTLRCTVTNEAGDSVTGTLVLPVGK